MREHIKEKIAHVNFETFNCIDNFLDRLLCNKKAKFVYKDLVDRNVQLPTEKFLQWEKLLGIEIADWSEYYIILRKSCKDTYLRTFQYKFLHRIIATNTLLYKVKLKNSKLCTFCKVSDEIMEHLFYECPITHFIWQCFSQKLKQYFVNFTLSKKHIFLGLQNESLLLNLMIINAKNFIYKCKLYEKKPSIIGLLAKIRKYQENEHYIAKKNGTTPFFQKFWAPVDYIFTD